MVPGLSVIVKVGLPYLDLEAGLPYFGNSIDLLRLGTGFQGILWEFSFTLPGLQGKL